MNAIWFQFFPVGIRCQLCHMMFGDQSAINAHYDTAHSERRRARPGEGTYECELCGNVLSEKSALKRHLSVVHGVGDVKTFQCNVCSNVYKRADHLRRHMRVKHA